MNGLEEWWPILITAVSVGIAYGVLKMKLNDTAEQLSELEDTVSRSLERFERELQAHRVESADRFARIETKLDLLLSTRLKEEIL